MRRIRRRRSRLVVVLPLTLALLRLPGLAGPNVAAAGQRQPADDQKAVLDGYVDLVRRYRSGNAPEAVEELASWNTKDVRSVARQLASILRSATEADAAESVGDLRAAAGLHMAVAARSWRHAQDWLVLEHVDIAAAFEELLVRHDPAYASLWCRVGGTLLAATLRWGAALERYERCLTRHPRDAWLLLGRGSTLEGAAIAMEGLPHGRILADWHGPQDAGSHVERAVADYEAAVDQAPDLAEGHIRLARLRLQTGDLEAAARHLSLALRNQLPPVPAYWAHLFFGAVEERAGKPSVAATHYRKALSLYPKAQAAGIALAHVLAERLGAPHDGLTALRKQIAPPGNRSFSSDPWWLYPGGQAWRTPEWLDEIERRSRQ